MKRSVHAALLMLAHSLPASAASADVEPGLAGLGRVIASLIVVIAMILAAGWLLKRFPAAGRTGGRVRTLESVAVGMKERVVLVQVGERQVLLGVAPGHVSTLMVLEQPLPEPSRANAPPLASSFASLLRGARGDQR
ncbi:MAG: flagellar biosynthetic protein FliO [Dokdonella sp.]